jgi:hypothetical protein
MIAAQRCMAEGASYNVHVDIVALTGRRSSPATVTSIGTARTTVDKQSKAMCVSGHEMGYPYRDRSRGGLHFDNGEPR